MSDFETDLATLRDIGPIADQGFCQATPCLRVDLTCPAPLSKRPVAIDALLVEAAQLMQAQLTRYAAEGQELPSSAGRKFRAGDLDTLAGFFEAMARSEARDKDDMARSFQSLRDQGFDPDIANFSDPLDSGNLLISDAFPVDESGNHIQLQGHGAWGISVSFSLDLVAAKADQVFDLAERFLTSGIGTSGSFGFAYNTASGRSPESAAYYYLPPTRRFQLLSMVLPAECRFDRDVPGILPLNSWYWLDDAHAEILGLSSLEGADHGGAQVTKHATGHLIKFFDHPSLGDINTGADVSPLHAIGAHLDKIFAQPQAINGVPLGDVADCTAWLRRFGPQFAKKRTS